MHFYSEGRAMALRFLVLLERFLSYPVFDKLVWLNTGWAERQIEQVNKENNFPHGPGALPEGHWSVIILGNRISRARSQSGRVTVQSGKLEHGHFHGSRRNA
jgi:hypothetical protein